MNLIDQLISQANEERNNNLGREITNRDREITNRDREINLTTNNLTTNNPSRDLKITRDESGLRTSSTPDVSTSSLDVLSKGSSLVSTPDDLSMMEQISGINIQKKKYQKDTLCFYLTIQFKDQVELEKANTYTAYLKPRSRGREFRPSNKFEEQLYAVTVEYKDWYIGRVTERSAGGRVISGYVATFDPGTKQFTLWFEDYSGAIDIPIDNGFLTPKQEVNFECTGHWGEEVKIEKPVKIGPRDCRTFTGRK